MTTEQLNVLGNPDVPEDLELGVTQRAVMRTLRRLGSITRDEAGAIAHAGRGKHQAEDRCQFCGVDGDPILAALVKRGLAEKTVGGSFKVAPPAAAVAADGQEDDIDPFPPGF